MEYGPVRKLCGDALADSHKCREVEASNLPTVFVGGVETWPAISRWNPEKGGLHHLKSLAGSTIVQGITSNSGSAFYGHIRGHDRVPVSFGGFIDRIASVSKNVTCCGSFPPQATSGNDARIPVRGVPIDEAEANIETTRKQGEDPWENGALDGQLYLAQVPIFSKEAVQETTLSPLMQDIEMPTQLKSNGVSDINLWMSMTDSRSSTHYDPYQNLLCVVAGEKKVTLWPPSAAPFLYPLPINGEASNHSGVDFVQPDYKAHPLFRKALSVAQLVVLHPGDALFIPEGWYHQVDNSGVTIAVNFWWPSKVSLALGTHMDAYFFRRVLVKTWKNLLVTCANVEKSKSLTTDIVYASLQNCDLSGAYNISTSLVDQEKDRMLGEDLVQVKKSRRPLVTDPDNSTSGPIPSRRSGGHGEVFVHSVEESQEVYSDNVNTTQLTDQLPKQLLKLEDLTALESYSLNCLLESFSRQPADTPHEASEVHHSATQSTNGSRISDAHQENSKEISWEGVSGHLQMDLISRVFSTTKVVSLQRILLVMANHFPRMLETMMLTSLSPSAAEILTRKFEELDASTENVSQANSISFVAYLQSSCTDNSCLDCGGAAFYEQFYGSFESPDAVMEALLKGKEAFAAQALRNVLTQFLSIDCTQSSSSR